MYCGGLELLDFLTYCCVLSQVSAAKLPYTSGNECPLGRAARDPYSVVYKLLQLHINRIIVGDKYGRAASSFEFMLATPRFSTCLV